jgi:hypothetical protein
MSNPGKPITFNGETLLMVEWARRLEIKYSTLKRRFAKCLSAERVLTAELLDEPSGRFYPAVGVGGGESIREHILIAERALGKPLPPGAEVHHVDEDKTNNAPSNLVICPSTAYHRLLHARARALDESGNANNRKCRFCKTWDSPSNLTVDRQNHAYHRRCNTEYQRSRRQAA